MTGAADVCVRVEVAGAAPRDGLPRPRPWAPAVAVRASTAASTAAATLNVCLLTARLRPAAAHTSQQGSVFVGVDAELTHRLAETQLTVAGHFRLEIRERDIVVLRLLQGGDELALVAESVCRVRERHP